jgi:TRAP-type C4-dicarboxylate transport system permease small subunit
MRVLRNAANALGGVLFLALFAVFVLQVVARFGFNRPLPWTDEAAVILYVWVILWASALMVPAREQVAFDLLWNAAPRRVRRWMAVAGHGLIGGLSLWALPATWDYVRFMGREGTPVLGLSFQWVFLPLVLLFVALAVRSGWAIVQALRGQGLDESLHNEVPQ